MWLWEEKDWVVSSISSAAVVLDIFFWPGRGDEGWPLRSLIICYKQRVFSLGKWPFRELLGYSDVLRSHPGRECATWHEARIHLLSGGEIEVSIAQHSWLPSKTNPSPLLLWGLSITRENLHLKSWTNLKFTSSSSLWSWFILLDSP